MRRGYLLTALAAVVLLAASPGTASAQSVGWNMTSGTAYEGATEAATTPALLTVKILRSGTPPQGTTLDQFFGTVSVQGVTGTDGITIASAPGSGSVADGSGAITWVNNEATLVISGDTDTNWMNEEVTLKLVSDNPSVSPSPDQLKISVMDAQVQPVVRFSKGSISLTEDSQTTVAVRLGAETATAADVPGDLTGIAGTLRVMITPADALYDATSNPDGPITIDIGGTALAASAAPNNQPGTYDIGTLSSIETATTNGARLTGTGIVLNVMARTDMSGFQDPMISVAFDASSLRTTSGTIMSGSALNIDVQSDEPVPTVSFSPTDVTIDEGGSVETVLISEGAHGSEVMEVTLSVEGDAMVGLYRGMDKLEANDEGNIVVDLGDSNSARLTARSYSDPDLMDGDTKYIAWKITDAGGADIGDGYWFRVDVMGSTAVPALPLVGQLLLALFLMAGGSRLYRRRQG